jgi:phage gp29-like protein
MVNVTSAPRLGSVRNEMSLGMARNLNPQRLANLLRAAEQDDPDAYLSLAEEMEERDPHYLGVLGTRKRQVSQLPMTLAAAGKEEIDQIIAKDIQENIVDKGILDAAAFDALDAIGKGFSLHEIVWDTHTQQGKWLIECLEYVNPRFVRHDRETQRKPMLMDHVGRRHPLPQYKFAYLETKAKSGLVMRSGLARAVAWAYMFKNFALKDWVQFCEVYGIPWRIGRYDSSATEDDKDALLRAVCSLASDAAAIAPKTMDIEITESGATTASSGLFKDLLTYIDDQVSKLVLGQTRTMESTGGGINNGDAGTQVREDIERADAKTLELCFNRDVIRVYVLLNYGSQAKVPYLTIGRPEQKNVQLMIDAADKLAGRMPIRVADIREAVGFAEPQDNDELIGPPPSASPFGLPPALSLPPPGGPAPATPPPTDTPLNGAQITAVLEVTTKLIAREIPPDVAVALIAAVGIAEDRAREMVTKAMAQPKLEPTPPPVPDQKPALAAARVRAELLAQELAGGADAIALAAQQQATSAPQVLKPLVDQVLKLASLSQDEHEFRRRLAAYNPDAELNDLADRLAILTFQSLAGGIVGDRLRE